LELVEIGPRFSLNPIKIFKGFMGGEVIYSNKFYIPPIQIKRDLREVHAQKFLDKMASKKRKNMNKKFVTPQDELDRVFDTIEKYEKGEVDNFDGKPNADEDFDDTEN
jgi:ribosome biogenesis protein BRX1